ncbi:MAG: HAD-IC family P-type ATPase, partial [Ignavibacteriae bacterium]|nr:HAD-IC family P-type ATPase [Ignavibacteriota bacterium]
ITSVVFDKTGTITQNFFQGGKSEISFIGDELTDFELSLVKTLVRQSTHPLSRKIYEHLAAYKVFEMQDFSEKTGQGITGLVLNNLVTVGSPEFITGKIGESPNRLFGNSSRVYLSVNNKVKGFFTISNAYRQGLAEVISGLEKNYDLHLLSGDNEGERVFLQSYFKDPLQMHFRQSPENKLKYIKAMQNEGLNVLMIGDGLNDAGALKQSDVGISVSEDVSNFSPACDAILDSADFPKLRDFVSFSKQSIRVIIISFAISFLYNIFVLLFALEGLLKPIIAAILMPVSSISVVVFCVIATNYLAKKHKFR